MKKRRKNRVRIAAIRIGIVLCAAGIGIGAFLCIRTWTENERSANQHEQLRKQIQANGNSGSLQTGERPWETEDLYESATPGIGTAGDAGKARASSLDFAALQGINGEIVAWLTCEGTAIDYPVLHTTDNDYYLSHLYTGEQNRMGSLFIDHRNTGLFTDQNTVIYGHNMRNGAMFHALSEYKAQNFYDAFPTMRLYTPEGDYLIELLAGTVESGDEEFVQLSFANDDAFLSYVDAFYARSTFVTDSAVTAGDRLVTLCTCSYEWNNARYALLGKLVESDF